MRVKISKGLAEDIDDGKLSRFTIDMGHFRYGTSAVTINLEELTLEKVKELERLIGASKVFGAKGIAQDLRTWLEAAQDEKNHKPDQYVDIKCRRLEFFATYLIKYFRKQRIHRLYISNVQRGVTYCSYVYDIEYHPEHRDSRGERIPEYVDFMLGWMEFGEENRERIILYTQDARYLTARAALARKGMFLETPALVKQYNESIKVFDSIYANVGEQYLAAGTGTDDVDEDNRRNWWRSRNSIVLDKSGEPGVVVIDTFTEGDEEETKRSNQQGVDTTWWTRNYEDHVEERMDEEIPIHPNLVVFALKKQMRLRVHVSQLNKYIYDNTISKKLILPKEHSNLIKTLVTYTGGFEDIVHGKGGGAVVLCSGAPGTGKTLTAEVYAEAMERPLYNVQCSQLGTDPDELEKSLLLTFSRSERWNAILLLDEADVYIRSRGDDLQQNAIVGVFLRVLEYYKGILFMTTNRGEIVDDAVASRCIAHIRYGFPENDEAAARLWRIQAQIQGLKLDEAVIKQLLKHYGHEVFNGRDMKNLFKLIKMNNGNNGKKVTLADVQFAQQFKPTG